MANVPPISNSTDSAGARSGQPARRRRWPKIVLFCVCGLVALGAAVAWTSFRLTAPAVDAAEAFLKATADGGPAVSYLLASPAFKAATSEGAWDSVARSRRLTAYRSATWTARSIDGNGTAELAGTMTFQDGDQVPVQINLIKSHEQWRVLAMRFPDSGVQPWETKSPSAAPTAPPEQAAGLSPQTGGDIQPTAEAAPQQRSQNALPPEPSAATSPIDTAMPAQPGGGTSQSWETTASQSDGSQAMPTAPSWSSVAQTPGVAVTSLSPPPVRTPVAGVSSLSPPDSSVPAVPMVPAAKVAGICMYLFSSRANLALDGVSCATGLRAVPGASIRCMARKNGQQAGVTVTLQGYNSSSSHPELSCVLDGNPT